MIATGPSGFVTTHPLRLSALSSTLDALLGEMVAHAEVPSFIVAPPQSGKTSLAAALAQSLALRGGSVWIDGSRPELLKESLRGYAKSGEQGCHNRLFIIDDLTLLDDRQAEDFSDCLDVLIEQGGRLVVICMPEHDCFEKLQSDRLLIDQHHLQALRKATTRQEPKPQPAHRYAQVNQQGADRMNEEKDSRYADEETPLLELRFLGDFAVCFGDRRVDSEIMRRSKAQSLFISLALNLGRGVPRELVLGRLWPEKEHDAALENFYTTWSRLATIFGSGTKNCPYLTYDRQVCRLNPQFVKLDLVEFEALAKAVLFWEGTRDDRIEAVYRLERLYRGDLLPAFDLDASTEMLRERYRTLQVDVLLTAAQLFSEIENETTAIWFARSAFDLDPSREDVYLVLMGMFDRVGQRTSAVRTYHDCKRYLNERLGLTPSQKTTDLYQELILGTR